MFVLFDDPLGNLQTRAGSTDRPISLPIGGMGRVRVRVLAGHGTA